MNSNIKGIGIDMIAFEELKPRITQSFVERILSPLELTLYDAISHSNRKLSFLAGRFAGKEAFVKAYQHFDVALNFNEVSIIPNAHGAPELQCDKIDTKGLFISISHTKEHAIAMVVRT